MRRHTDAQVLRLGAITVLVLVLALAASFNLSKMPGLAGTSYQAEFADASGLRQGNMVQVGGIRAGKVRDLEVEGDRVLVTFEVDPGVEFGSTSRASVEVLNLLGEKYLELQPDGPGQHAAEEPIPLERTEAAYDIVGVLGDLTGTTEEIDVRQLQEAVNTIADTVDAAGPEMQESLTGLSRLSRAVSARDEQLESLLASSRSVSTVLADTGDQLVDLMAEGRLVFEEIRQRRRAIHRLLVSARTMARELRGLAEDNQEQIQPALDELDEVLTMLNNKDRQLKKTIAAAGPYAEILGNIIGTGPWFDAYVVNLAGLATGEFEVRRGE